MKNLEIIASSSTPGVMPAREGWEVYLEQRSDHLKDCHSISTWTRSTIWDESVVTKDKCNCTNKVNHSLFNIGIHSFTSVSSLVLFTQR
jgi:hypothetical protein